MILIGSWLVLHAAVLVAGVVLLVRNQRKSGAVATVIPVLAVLELAVFFSMPSRLEFAQQRQTQLMLRRIEGRIREYVESNHERPRDIAPLFRSRPSDAWGTPLQYDAAPEQETWILRSAGPDRQFDTPDDVTVTSPDLHAPD